MKTKADLEKMAEGVLAQMRIPRHPKNRIPIEDALATVHNEAVDGAAGRLVMLARAALGDGRPQAEVDSLMELSRIIRAGKVEP